MITDTKIIREQVATYCRYLQYKVRLLSFTDLLIAKLGWICFGAFLSTLFSNTAKKLKGVFLVGTLVTAIYFIWKLFLSHDEITKYR